MKRKIIFREKQRSIYWFKIKKSFCGLQKLDVESVGFGPTKENQQIYSLPPLTAREPLQST